MSIKELVNLPASRLKRVVALKTQIERLESRLESLITSAGPASLGKIVRTRRKMSAAARRKISAAAKARWARYRAAKGK